MGQGLSLGTLLLLGSGLGSGLSYAQMDFEGSFVVVTPEQAEPLEALEERVRTCTRESTTRRVIVDYPRGTALPCRVIYDKSEEATAEGETIWQAINEEGYCESKADNLAEKLEGWGWSCSEREELREELVEAINAPSAR